MTTFVACCLLGGSDLHRVRQFASDGCVSQFQDVLRFKNQQRLRIKRLWQIEDRLIHSSISTLLDRVSPSQRTLSMEFTIGDQTDRDHCDALQDEFIRCRDAFNEFKQLATVSLSAGQDPWRLYKTRHAYSTFTQHLYEFMRGAHARDTLNTRITNKNLTNSEKAKLDEAYITGHTQRLLEHRRSAILNGTAPVWENDVSYYPERVPPEFARTFRVFRNNHSHVTHERSKLNIADFYEKYHKYLHLLLQEARWWSPKESELTA